MASLADGFKEKERLNWLKAWLAIDIAKSGLEHLADNEAQTFHQHIYSQVTSTLKSQSATCTSCNTTNLLRNQKCPNQICDKVCKEIIKEHRYNKCSWNNTSAPLWQTHYWEIAKCFIQTDGYADKISIQDTDFNGVVSFMLNCTRFDSKFSFPITKGKPTHNNPACLLYKAREVHKAVRHSSIMKVTDVDLQDYFTSLNNLLNDSSYLSQDNFAKNAVVKLAQLEKDTLLLTTTEMMCFLDAVGTTLKQHLKDIAKDVVDASVDDLRVNTAFCIDNIRDFTRNCKQELAKQADIHKQDIDEHVDSKKQGIDDHTERHKQGMDENADRHKQGMDKHADRHKQGMDEHAGRHKQSMDENADKHKQGMDEHADRHKQGMHENADRHKQGMDEHADIHKQGMDEHAGRHKQGMDEHAGRHKQGMDEHAGRHKQSMDENADRHKQGMDEHAVRHKQGMDENADRHKQGMDEHADRHKQGMDEHAGRHKQSMDEHADRHKQGIDEHVSRHKQCLDEQAEKCIKDIQEQFGNTTFTETTYKQSCKDMLGDLTKYYRKRFSHINIFPLDDWAEEKLLDIYMPPNIQLMAKERGYFKKTGEHILKYEHIFLSDTEPNQQIFIQGEAGYGKSTFLAKLVMDWCTITSEQSAETTLPLDDNTTRFSSYTQMRYTNVFDDLTSLKDFKFVFHVTLRESVSQFEIEKMIQTQIVDSIYSSEKDRGKAYILLNEIMKRERCLVLLDGLDEWIGTGDHHNLPTLADVHSLCVLLITTRPWKMTEAKILDSQICKLLQLDGVNKVFEVSRKILGCMKEFKGSQDLDKKQSEFESYVRKFGLLKHLYSPMMLCLIVHSWTKGTELNGSLCEKYSLLLECLFKKVNIETSEFQEPPYRCFTETQNIQPNIEHLNRLAEAAFYLLFSDTQEKALVFTITELKKFNLGQLDQENFALKSGILSVTRKASALRSSSSFSFIHKSIQEFLAAYHIACNTNVIDDVIFGYLNRHKDAYLDISQVFIFLCGLNMQAANKVSGMMDEHDVGCFHFERPKFRSKLVNIILAGYREAVANQQKDILLKLSVYHLDFDNDIHDLHSIWTINSVYYFNFDNEYYAKNVYNDIRDLHSKWTNFYNDIRDLHSIWTNNKSDVLYMDIYVPDRKISQTGGESAPHIEFDLSSCNKLKYLILDGKGILLSDFASTSTAEHLVGIVLKSADLFQCADPPPLLPSIKYIKMCHVTCSYTCLRCLFCTLLTLDHALTFDLQSIYIKCAEAAKREIRAFIHKDVSNSFIVKTENDNPYLFNALHGLNIKSLSLSIMGGGLNVAREESLSQSLSSLTQLDTLSIRTEWDNLGLWNALHGLNIKSLSLNTCDMRGGFDVVHGQSPSLSLSSLTQLETLSIDLWYDSLGLWKALHGLNIKSLSLSIMQGGLNVANEESLSLSLSSLTQLETLSIEVKYDSPGLWKNMHGLNIKSLSLSLLYVRHVESLSQALSSLTKLETLSIRVQYDSPGPWKALHGLNIKSLSLSVSWRGLNVYHDESLSKSLTSLTQLETVTPYVKTYHQIELPQSLKYLNIYCDGFLPSKVLELVDTLPTCTHKVGSNLKLCCFLEILLVENIPLEKYTVIQQELQTRKNFTVERFQISDRKLETNFVIQCE
ncbi:uncharacterized protein LOC127841290 isoform X3 [Dreissena polymorpha]|uniref:uncharacterized protein LOC127841290 isoform X3 n=1 Tax=Dreissena polymorpha TaxID=45954 RepID=UPI0022655A21|nr:uncharacterized protein LOC127841290 isoform X3 [Dreissena polymorpha]